MDAISRHRNGGRGRGGTLRGVLFVVLAMAALAAACTGNPPPPAAAQACAPPDSSQLPAAFDAGGLAGTFDLQVFADEGQAAGSVAEGRLALRAYPDGEAPRAGGVPVSLHGTLDAELGPLGAADTGPTTSEDPVAPGALVLEWRREGAQRPEVLIRLGARSNRMDQVVFEGAYTVLRVYDASGDGLAGRWESGAPRRPAAGGRFCGVRIEG